jgi:hypothetical protein
MAWNTTYPPATASEASIIDATHTALAAFTNVTVNKAKIYRATSTGSGFTVNVLYAWNDALASGSGAFERVAGVAGSYAGTAASQVAMLALTATKGDWCIRTDPTPDERWDLTGTDPTVLGNWTQNPVGGAGSGLSIINQTAAELTALESGTPSTTSFYRATTSGAQYLIDNLYYWHTTSSSFKAVDNDQVGLPISVVAATSVAINKPTGVLKVACIVAGTITIYDNNAAASGTLVLSATTMTAGQIITINSWVSNGLYVATSGGATREWRVTVTEL